MSTDKEVFKPYVPEHPVDEATRKKGEQEIRDAAKRAAQQRAAEELGKDNKPMTREEAEKEMHKAAPKAEEEKKKK